MDIATQSILGGAIAEAGFRGKLGGKAVAFGALLGLAPDLDLVTRLAGPWAYLVYHRGSSHSLIVLPLLAPLLAWLGWRWAARRGGYLPWLHLTLWVLVTHVILDLLTTYGTQPFAPFSRARYAFDAVAIIDPFYTVPLLAALVLALVPRVPRRIRRNVAVGALALTTAYLGLGGIQSSRAAGMGRRQLVAEGFRPAEIRATPMIGSVWVWRVVGKNEAGDYRVGVLSTWAPHPIEFMAFDRTDSPLIDKALASPQGRIFEWFAMGMVHAEVARLNGRPAVLMRDMRYGMVKDLSKSVFSARALFDEEGRLISVERVSGNRGDMSLRTELGALWGAFWGRER